MPKLYLFFCITFLLSCKTNKNSVNEKGDCDTIGRVKDFTGLDGCGLMIVLENGEKLNPAEITDENFDLKDGQNIHFGFKRLKGMMSICMSEDAIVKITCIEELEPEKPCANTKNPFEIDWMNRVLDRYNPTEIIKYKYEKEWAYEFEGSGFSYLYNCQGEIVCKNFGNSSDPCTVKYFPDLTNAKVIWEGEGIWD